ncbi:GcrA family cell cycle regulator [Rubrimonas cliftonensis]|uniref:GcrA cell cycle regulator n=1 Tax=Rubrimonas cliftonensis TaxID=89524 RepID=A0A1H3YWT8_9RHOB|nr:GcrA family cell cycle regulator [Rubrimonas cliftonensis]SEA15568.1 GcrA cell cycle regulator [Rubrimonas cliftonensis]
MSWTDERVEKLQQLWAEGQSAAQIAKALGGVTRNAVIGKVHRLGLSNRAAAPRATEPAEEPASAAVAEEAASPPASKPAEQPAAAAPSPEPETEPEPVEAATDADEEAPEPAVARAPARDPLRREPAPMTEERLEVLANLAEIEKTARRVTLMDLTERVCKWPIGDPTDPAFRFCGLPAQQGKPYCAAHVAVAFQPMSSRRDRDRQRVRS